MEKRCFLNSQFVGCFHLLSVNTALRVLTVLSEKALELYSPTEQSLKMYLLVGTGQEVEKKLSNRCLEIICFIVFCLLPYIFVLPDISKKKQTKYKYLVPIIKVMTVFHFAGPSCPYRSPGCENQSAPPCQI